MIDPKVYETPATILISYDEVFRNHNFFLIKKIMNNPKLKNQFEKYINLSVFDEQTDSRIKVLIMNREKKNILEWLAIKEFDYEYNYDKLYSKELLMFVESPMLDMMKSMIKLSEEPFIDKIYIYGGLIKDKRKEFDIHLNFKDTTKLIFVTGNYEEVVDRIFGINVIIDSDINRITPIIKKEEYQNIIYMIAQYGYNYEINKNSKEIVLKNNIENFIKENNIILNKFLPFNIKHEDLYNG